MSTSGLSKARLGRMHDVMAGHVARGALPGLVTLVSRRELVGILVTQRLMTSPEPPRVDFWTSAYQAIDD